ncbi:MAG: hypothetical protein JSS89_10955, partial [Bacteroidetes bacterium]|nr:hypothetical protein [Bacteroidota bacterium]
QLENGHSQTRRRKIELFSLTMLKPVALGKERVHFNTSLIIDVLEYIEALPTAKKQMFMEDETKFHYLGDVVVTGKLIKLTFWSARFNSTPDLIHADTLRTRKNPKHLREGEREKTHILLSIQDHGIVIAKEFDSHGLFAGTFRRYLNEKSVGFLKDSADPNTDVKIEFDIDQMIDDSFMELLNSSRRATILRAKVLPDILVNEFGPRLRELPNTTTVDVEMKAGRGNNLKDIVMMMVPKIGKKNLLDLRVRIADETDEHGSVDRWIGYHMTPLQEQVQVKLDENNQVDSEAMFRCLLNSIKDIQL